MEHLSLTCVIRGEEYRGDTAHFPSRHGSVILVSPDPTLLLDHIIQQDPEQLQNDFSGVTTQDIIDFLVETGEALDFDHNPCMQEAYRLSTSCSGLTPSVLEGCYRAIPSYFTEPVLQSFVNEVGSRFLDGWVEVSVPTSQGRARVRAYGAKILHILAGNVPSISVKSLIRNALVRSDGLFKIPSNDPFTAAAIVRTMRMVDFHHPVVKHANVLYWKGGDQAIEDRIFGSRYLEKVIAWGGPASIQHIRQRIATSDIDLITLNPKSSISIIGEKAFHSQETMRYVASLAARDTFAFNQQTCFSPRVHFIKGSADDAVTYAHLLYQSMQDLAPSLSTRPASFPQELQENLDALRYMDDFYSIIGGADGEGAVVVSLTGEPVDFFCSSRTVNVVPVQDYAPAFERVTTVTQSVSVYPESLKELVTEPLIARGVQRITSLGQIVFPPPGVPHDAMHLTDRMVKWIVDEIQPQEGKGVS